MLIAKVCKIILKIDQLCKRMNNSSVICNISSYNAFFYANLTKTEVILDQKRKLSCPSFIFPTSNRPLKVLKFF